MSASSLASGEGGQGINVQKLIVGAGIGIAIILIIYIIVQARATSVGENDDQAVVPPEPDEDLFNTDPTSPVIIQGTDYSREPGEIISSICAASTFFNDQIIKISQTSSQPRSVVENIFGSLLKSFPNTPDLRVAALEAYMAAMANWYQLFESTTGRVISAVTTMTAAALNVPVPTTCAKTVYIDHSVTTIKQDTSYVTTKKEAGWMCLLAGGKTNTTEWDLSGSYSKTVSLNFVPYCERLEVDPAAVVALMATQSLGVTGAYVSLNTVLNMCPSINSYCALG